MDKEALYYKNLYEKTREILNSQTKEIETELSSEGISAELENELLKKQKALGSQLSEIDTMLKEGPKEPVTLESLGVMNKGEKAEERFQAMIAKGMDPEDIKDIFMDYPDVKSEKKDKKEGEDSSMKKDEEDSEKKDESKDEEDPDMKKEKDEEKGGG